MDELIHHCLKELAFDGDLGESKGNLGRSIPAPTSAILLRRVVLTLLPHTFFQHTILLRPATAD